MNTRGVINLILSITAVMILSGCSNGKTEVDNIESSVSESVSTEEESAELKTSESLDTKEETSTEEIVPSSEIETETEEIVETESIDYTTGDKLVVNINGTDITYPAVFEDIESQGFHPNLNTVYTKTGNDFLNMSGIRLDNWTKVYPAFADPLCLFEVSNNKLANISSAAITSNTGVAMFMPNVDECEVRYNGLIVGTSTYNEASDMMDSLGFSDVKYMNCDYAQYICGVTESQSETSNEINVVLEFDTFNNINGIFSNIYILDHDYTKNKETVDWNGTKYMQISE